MSRMSTARVARRRSAPKVKNGKVQRKNRTRPTRTAPLIRREQPGAGHRHYVRKNDVLKFIELLPQWNELSIGLEEIVLAKAEEFTQGWCDLGKVAICAWSQQCVETHIGYDCEEHMPVYRRLGIPFHVVPGDHDDIFKTYQIDFDEESVRAYQLLHILLHELGHHHDRMTTRHQDECARGESYAEAYAIRHETLIFERYCEVFGYHRPPFTSAMTSYEKANSSS